MREEETCDICGRPGLFAIVSVEGAKLRVCGPCARGKKILYRLEEIGEEKGGPAEYRPVGKTEETEEIAEDYGKVIRTAREKMGLTVEVIAERINENAGYLERIEKQSVVPTLAVARKLEKELNIKIIEKVTASVTPTASKTKFSEPTLGDLVEGE